MSDREVELLLYSWEFWRRPAQTAPDWSWLVWLICAGRGFGKTRTGAEWVREQVEEKGKRRIALVGRTKPDVRKVMVEGESGILAISPPYFRPIYTPSNRELKWPNGAIATTYSADEPDQLRGPQHDAAWCDELAAFRYPDAWDQLNFGLRLGNSPQICVTTTPRPTKLIKELIKDESTAVTRGSSYDNFENLAQAFIKRIIKKYEGTTLGRQELWAEILKDIAGALWTSDLIEATRVRRAPEMMRVVVAIDPATTSNEKSAKTGIVVSGLGIDDHKYVLDDLSMKGRPNEWAKKAIEAFHEYEADRIVAEVNNGGDLVEEVLRHVDDKIPYTAVHASRGKRTRAEPVSAQYEKEEVHHVGMFPELEDQMTTWVPLSGDPSPDEMDALVWSIAALDQGYVDDAEVDPDAGYTGNRWDDQHDY